MGARKGQNNCKGYQDGKVSETLALIAHNLNKIRRGQKFADTNALIRYVSDRSGLHRSTIPRNLIYLRAVLAFQAQRPGVVLAPQDDTASKAKLKADAVVAELDLRRLRGENKRLLAALAARGAPLGEATPSPERPAAEEAEWKVSFLQTAALLATLLDRLASKDLGIVWDPKTGEIHDQAEIGADRVVAGRPRTDAFLKWLEQHAATGAGRNV